MQERNQWMLLNIGLNLFNKHFIFSHCFKQKRYLANNSRYLFYCYRLYMSKTRRRKRKAYIANFSLLCFGFISLMAYRLITINKEMMTAKIFVAMNNTPTVVPADTPSISLPNLVFLVLSFVSM